LVCYCAFYYGIEHRRSRSGPWQVAFTHAGGEPAIRIFQSALGISNVDIIFPGETAALANTNDVLVFGQPRQVPYSLPFGRCIFMDTTFLPGTVTFNLFDHEIELLPRVLIIDHEEHAWRPDAKISLHRAQQPLPSAKQ